MKCVYFCCVKSWGNTFVYRFFFSKVFDSIQREKMEQMLLAFGLPKETTITIILLYKCMKVVVCLPDGNIVFFDIIAEVL